MMPKLDVSSGLFPKESARVSSRTEAKSGGHALTGLTSIGTTRINRARAPTADGVQAAPDPHGVWTDNGQPDQRPWGLAFSTVAMY
jgi:hypothetical protein